MPVDASANFSTRPTGHRLSHVRITADHMFSFPCMPKLVLMQHLQYYKRQQLEDYCMVIRTISVNKCEMEFFVIMQRNSVVFRYQLANSSCGSLSIFIILVAEKFAIDQSYLPTRVTPFGSEALCRISAALKSSCYRLAGLRLLIFSPPLGWDTNSLQVLPRAVTIYTSPGWGGAL